MDWYVLQAFSGYENKVKLALEDRIKRSGLQDSFEEISFAFQSMEQMGLTLMQSTKVYLVILRHLLLQLCL